MMKREIKFGKMLDLFRQEKNMTMEELGAYLGRNKSTVSRWISGERYPKIEEVEQIVSFFDTDVETLLFGADKIDAKNSILSLINETSSQLSPPRQQKVYDFAKHELEEQKEQKSHITVLEKYKENEKKEKEYVDIFWYGSASAGTGQFLFSNKELISLPKEQVPIEADFCLTVSGDSMEPVLHNGDYIFVTKQNTLFNRSIGVVIVDGEAFIKKVFFENDKARLQSFNKKYKDIIVDDSNDFRIIGKVVL
ncbi:XRE family transcriptional regulator [Enterococcus faecium]|nr:helix-turn-helix transcriptional regulator [Enterococcus faecium]EGP5128718.1 XRE family transcriptional regulator [Enterococcus faecium]EME7139549.1 helix-turn-helix transcriptional regulator [Enterococcus faecium]EME8273583.1 helix-turn-helix transcriptional regulator [Enterococcus faecium]